MFTVSDNTPSAGCIQWSGLHMQYNGQSFTIQDGYTNYMYVYWNHNTPTQLVVSNTLPTNLTDADCLVFLNKNGVHLTIPTATILDGDLLVPGSVVAGALAANSVSATNIQAGAITANALAAGSVTANAIAANAIGATAIVASTITGDKLVAGAITGDKIAANTITGNNIAANTITAANMVAGTITATQIASNTITGAQIAANTLTADKISVGMGSVLSGNLITSSAVIDSPVAYTTTTLSSAASSGASSVSVTSATGAIVGGSIIFASERKTISAINGTTITLGSALSNSYASGASVSFLQDNLVDDGNKKVGSTYFSFGTGNSGNNNSEGAYIQIDLGATYRISESRLYFYSGDARYYWYKIKYSVDGTNWFYVVGTSSNTGWVLSVPSTWGMQINPTIDDFMTPISARYIRVYSNGNSVNTSNHIYEWELFSTSPTTIDGGQIITGTLTADKIYGGTLTLGGVGNGNGVITVKNSLNSTWLTIDNGSVAAVPSGDSTSNIACYTVTGSVYGTKTIVGQRGIEIQVNGSDVISALVTGSTAVPVINCGSTFIGSGKLAVNSNLADLVNNSPWYGIGYCSGWTWDSLAGSPTQVAGYWGLRMRSQNTYIDLHQNYISMSGSIATDNDITFYRWFPKYSTWVGNGDGGAAIVNSAESQYQALMIVGNNSGGGSRKVHLWDDVTVDNYLYANYIIATNNGNGTNFRIGDDSWLGDINEANTCRLSGVTDGNVGGIRFGLKGAHVGTWSSDYGRLYCSHDGGGVEIYCGAGWMDWKVNSGSGCYVTMNTGFYSGSAGSEPVAAPVGSHADCYGGWGYSTNRFYRMYSTQFNTSSDKELKENVQTYNAYEGYDMLKSLKFYTYTYKEKNPYDIRIGTMAQDCPYIVSDVGGSDWQDPKETWNIDLYSYASLIGSVTQVLQQKIEDLESKLLILESKVT